MAHQDFSQQISHRGVLSTIWHKIIHQRLIYLFFFTVGASVTLIISIFFSGETLITIKIIEIAVLSIAVIIKTLQALKKLNCKQLIKTQSQFPIPYLFTVLNIFLLIEACNYLNEYNPSTSTVNVQYAVIESFRFFFMTYMCSLVTNKKTTSKLEYWYYTAIIIIVVCCDVYVIVLKIRTYGKMIDSMNDQLQENLVAYIRNEISSETYAFVKNFIGKQQTAIQNASAVDIACVASVVANYLVMMDMIARPIEKIKETEHLLHEVHSSIHGSHGKSDINYQLLAKNITINHSAAESQRTQSERKYQSPQNNNTEKVTKRNTNLQLEPRKSRM